MQIIRKLAAGKFILIHLLIFFICRYIFAGIVMDYISPECLKDSTRNYPIDVNIGKGRPFIDDAYVRDAAHNCYIRDEYFAKFFPLDMFFPIVYTLLLFSMINLGQLERGRKVIALTILAGMGADYLEDWSFALYLSTDVGWLALSTAIFTKVKIILLLSNAVVSLLNLWWWTWRGPRI